MPHTHNVFFVAQRLAERFFVQKKHRFDQVEVPEPILEFCRPTVLVMTCLGRVLRIFRVWFFSLGYFFGVFSYRSGWFFTCLEQVGAPNSTYRGYNSSYPFIRLFLGVILPFITSGGPHWMDVRESVRERLDSRLRPEPRSLAGQDICLFRCPEKYPDAWGTVDGRNPAPVDR